jgi:hypothetical protein
MIKQEEQNIANSTNFTSAALVLLILTCVLHICSSNYQALQISVYVFMQVILLQFIYSIQMLYELF